MNVLSPFFFNAKLYPRRPALVWVGGGVSYALLAQNVLTVAHRLREAGITRADIAAIDVRVANHHAVTMLALMHLGVASTSLEQGRREAAERAGITLIIADHPIPETAIRIVRVHESWFAPQKEQPAASSAGFTDEADVIRFNMTSGATGRPQIVPISVRDLMRGVARHRFFDVEGRTLSLFGFSAGVGARVFLRSMLTGGTFCLAGSSQEAYDAIQLYGVERLLASTIQLRDLTRRAQEAGEPLHSLKSVVVGGSSLSARLIANAQRFVCSNLIVHYASTQAGLVAVAPVAALEGRPGAAGFIVPQVEVECVDEAGQPALPGEIGELRIRSPSVHERARYAREGVAAGFRDGWFYPGDVGRIDADGMLIIVGRKSEIINVGGVKIAPDLVDEVLAAQPGVRDAAAFAYHNDHGEEELWAAVVTEAPPDVPALLAACRQALGGGAPAVILRATAIPRNAVGKAMRAQLSRDIEILKRQGREGAGG